MSSQHSNKMDSNNVEEMESFVKRLSKNESENKSCCDKIKNHQRLIIIISLIISMVMIVGIALYFGWAYKTAALYPNYPDYDYDDDIIYDYIFDDSYYDQFEDFEEACSGVLCGNSGENLCEGAATFINRNGNETR